MLRFWQSATIVCMAVALLSTPVLVHAAPTDNGTSNRIVNSAKPETTTIPTTQSMSKSVKLISALLSEKIADKQVRLFTTLVKNRLSYATARSLCGRENDWLVFVDLYQDYSGGKPQGVRLQQATVQYGLNKLPKNVQSVTLSIGNSECTLKNENQYMFRFTDFDLEKSALTGDVTATVKLDNGELIIPLTQELPGKTPDIEKALAAMTPAYIAYAQKNSPMAIDHSFMRLRSYVRNMTTFERAYIWELYLVHAQDLPAQATILRWDSFSNTTSVCVRELSDAV